LVGHRSRFYATEQEIR